MGVDYLVQCSFGRDVTWFQVSFRRGSTWFQDSLGVVSLCFISLDLVPGWFRCRVTWFQTSLDVVLLGPMLFGHAVTWFQLSFRRGVAFKLVLEVVLFGFKIVWSCSYLAPS